MIQDGDAAPGAGRGRGLWTRTRPGVRWSPALAMTLCERVAGGELLYAVCLEAGMPTSQSVARWARERPDFALALQEARRAGGRPGRGGGGVWTYCEATAGAIFERLCAGESLTAIGDDPTMPCLSTIFYWKKRIPDFADAIAMAREIQAQRLCDEGWSAVQAATPETAYLTHVRLTHLRWMTGVMAPRVYRTKAVEPEGAQKRVDVLMRRFEIEADPVTGKNKVVAYCPNPETGEVEREDTPGWRRPPGVPLPG